MQIVEVKITELVEAEYNPRKMTEQQAGELKDSIQRFGIVDPILVNKNQERHNVVIGGHQRLRIARLLGFDTVPVVYLDLSLEKERELNLRLNKNVGSWDWDMLANFEPEDLLAVGFQPKDLEFQFGEKETPELPEIQDMEGGMQSITVYYEKDVMEEILSKINSYEGANISEKVKNLITATDYGDKEV